MRGLILSNLALLMCLGATTVNAQVLTSAFWNPVTGSPGNTNNNGTLSGTTLAASTYAGLGGQETDNWAKLLGSNNLGAGISYITNTSYSAVTGSAARIGAETTGYTQSIKFGTPTLDPILLVNYGTSNISINVGTANVAAIFTSAKTTYNAVTGLVTFNTTNTNDPTTGFYVQFNGTYGNGTNGYNPLTLTLNGLTGNNNSAVFFTLGAAGPPQATPEPGSLAMLAGLGIGGFVALRRKRTK